MGEEAGQQGASINGQGRVFERGKRLSDDVILWVVTLFKKKGHSPAEIASAQGIAHWPLARPCALMLAPCLVRFLSTGTDGRHSGRLRPPAPRPTPP